MAYDSLDAIQKDFGKRIKDTDSDDEKRELAAQQREAVVDFKEAQADARLLEAHRTAVIAEKGLGEWGDMVTGATAEEITAKATVIAERVAKLSAVANDVAAGQQYGSAGAAGGAAASVEEPEEVAAMHDFEQRFNQSTRGSAIRRGDGAKVTAQEIESYTGKLLAARAIGHLAESSSSPRVRGVMQQFDLQTLKPKA